MAKLRFELSTFWLQIYFYLETLCDFIWGGVESCKWSVYPGYNDWFWSCSGIYTFFKPVFLDLCLLWATSISHSIWGIIMTGLVIRFSNWCQFHLGTMSVSLIFIFFPSFLFMNEELLGHQPKKSLLILRVVFLVEKTRVAGIQELQYIHSLDFILNSVSSVFSLLSCHGVTISPFYKNFHPTLFTLVFLWSFIAYFLGKCLTSAPKSPFYFFLPL